MIALYLFVLTSKATRIYIIPKSEKRLIEIMYSFIKLLVTFSIPILNILWLIVTMCKDEDEVILEMAKKNNWELKNQDNNGFKMQ